MTTIITIDPIQIEQELRCDLYTPPAEVHNGAAVVLVFGGAWRTGEPAQQKVYALALAKAGFTCLAADYRPSTEARWPAQLDDVLASLSWLREHAGDLNLDPERIAISGNSSGGHLALMVACTTPVKAVCAFYPPTELGGLDAVSGDDSVACLLGTDADQHALDSASPLHLVTKGFPPTLLISGQDDVRVPVHHTTRLSDALQELGCQVELHLFAGQGHAFDMAKDYARLCAALLVNFFTQHVE